MSAKLPNSLKQLVQAFCRLPGVGEKTALRYTLHLISAQHAPMETLSEALSNASANLLPCRSCGNIAERRSITAGSITTGNFTADSIAAESVAAESLNSGSDEDSALCSICLDSTRDSHQICVVARIPDLLALERSGAMRGRYFVLGQLLSPLDGVGPDELPLDRLQRQIQEHAVEELVIATPPSVEGEATALHLARQYGSQLRVTRIASGVPHGGDLEFADPITLGRALAGRRGLQED